MRTANARHVDWADRGVAVPVLLTVVLMPFAYSLTADVAAGVVSYTAIGAAQEKWREPGPFPWVLTAVFIVFFALHPIEQWRGVK